VTLISFRLENEALNVRENDKALSFFAGDREILALAKPVLAPLFPETERIDAVVREVVANRRDLFAERLLSGGREPTCEAVASVLPQTISYDLIGDEESKWKYLVYPDGRIGIWCRKAVTGCENADVFLAFDPAREGFPYAGKPSTQGLLAGYLQVSVMSFWDGNQPRWEQIAYAVTAAGQTRIHIRVRERGGEPVYFSILSPDCETPEEWQALAYCHPIETEADGFYAGLFRIAKKSRAILAHGMQAEFSDERMRNAARAGLLKSFDTYVGVSPRYGATNYFYEPGPGAESFAPTTTTMVDACLGWGQFERARQYLRYFLNRYVSPRGELLHRDGGATLAEAGMLLATIRRYQEYTHDSSFHDCWEFARKIIRHLLDCLAAAGDDLVNGCPEDDCRHWTHNRWYSINAWLCRGLLEGEQLARILRKDNLVPEEWAEFARELPPRAETLRGRLDASLRANLPPDDGIIPPYPDFTTHFPSLCANEVYYPGCSHKLKFPAYVNYRVYLEMLSAGVLAEDLEAKLIRSREINGGEFLGLSRLWDDLIDDWPLYNYLEALLRRDDIRKFLLASFAHMAHHQARDTFFAPESTLLGRLGRLHCLPCQLVIPLALRGMLAWEDADALWLAKATPRAWLENGQKVSLSAAPTRWGQVDFEIESRIDSGKALICLRFLDAAPPLVLLRLRLPRGFRVVAVQGESGNRFAVDHAREFVRIETGGAGEISFTAVCACEPDSPDLDSAYSTEFCAEGFRI
jgi:hypothetical protein